MRNGAENFDENLKVPNAQVLGDTCYYDNIRSIREKAQWVIDNNIGGAFTWDSSLDDFSGQFCNQGKFPLISTAINTLTGQTGSLSQSSTFSSFSYQSSTSTISSYAETSSSYTVPQFINECNGLS